MQKPTATQPATPPANPKRFYWIYGKKATGKTILATQLAGPDAVQITCRSTMSAFDRVLENRAVIIDEYHYRSVSQVTARFVSTVFDGNTIAKASPDSKSVRTITPKVEVLVIVSQHRPTDPAILSRFWVIKTKSAPTSR